MRSKRKRYKECFARNTYRIYPLIREIVKSTKVRRLESGSVICENKKVGKRKPVWEGKMIRILEINANVQKAHKDKVIASTEYVLFTQSPASSSQAYDSSSISSVKRKN